MNKKIIWIFLWCAVLIALGIALLTGQRDTFAWSTNDDYIDDDFWLNDRGNNDNLLINAMFGDGITWSDSSYYTQYWTNNSCDTSAMTVQHIAPWTDVLPQVLTGNTIYVLDIWSHFISTGAIFSGDCIWLTAKNSWYTTADIAYLYMTGDIVFSLSWNKNIIINNFYIDASATTAIQADYITDSAIFPMNIRYSTNAMVFHNISDVFIGWSISNVGVWLYIDGWQNIKYGTTWPVALSRFSWTGVHIVNTNDMTIDADVTYNTNIGWYFENVNNITINSRYWTENSWVWVSILSGSNINILWGSYSKNGSVWLLLQDITWLTLNGVTANQNTWHGIQVMNAVWVIANNITTHRAAWSNYGLTLSDSQDVSITNHYATGNGGYGIELYQVDNFNLQTINTSFNNVGWWNIYGSTSWIINNMTGANSTRSNGLLIDVLSNDIFITNSYFAGNNEDGLYVEGWLNITMNNIVSINNTGNGLQVDSTTGFSLESYLAENNWWYGVRVKDFSNSWVLFSWVTSYNGFWWVSINDTTNVTVDELLTSQNTTFWLWLSNASANIIRNIHTRENGNDGLLVQDSDLNTFTNITTYQNLWNWLSFNGADQNRWVNIISFNNTSDGVALHEKSIQNKLNYLQTYNNAMWVHVVDSLSERNVLSNILTYNNTINASVYNYTTLNNIASFNGWVWVLFAWPYNTINNANIFNNQDGIYFDATANSGSIYNAAVYNNLNGISLDPSAVANTYNWLNLFANTNTLIGTNGNDWFLSPTSYSRSIALPNNLAGSNIMTCERAIQATNTLWVDLLQYPYCDTRNVVVGWTWDVGVQYTFFPNIKKQQYPVEYIIPLPTIVTTTPDPKPMFIGDYVYSGDDALWGYITITGEQYQFTYQSGWFTYKNANSTDIDMLVNQITPTNYVITWVNSVAYDGITAQIGYLPFGSLPTYLYSTLYLDKTAWLNIARIAYSETGSQSNYYGFIRWLAMNDDISITKTASTWAVIPGQQIMFTITVTNSWSDPAGFSQVIDFLPTWIDGGSLIASPVWIYTGDVHAYIRDIPVVSGNTTYTFYLTGTVNSGVVDSQILNSWYFISDQTSNVWDWIITDEVYVDVLLPVAGGCGTAVTNPHYGQSMLNSWTVDLCSQWLVSWFTWPDLNGWYAWTCLWVNGWANASCTADENRCGDANIDAWNGEQCDTDIGLCSDTCQLEYPSCTISANPSYPVWFLTTYSLTRSWGSEIYALDLGDGTWVYQTWVVSSPYYYTYGTAGLYTATLYVQNELDSNYTWSCSFQVTIDPVCGNGVLESWEQCDDGNTNAWDGCSNFCTLDTWSCSIQAVPWTGYAPLNVTLNGTGSSGFLFDYIDYGDGTTWLSFNHVYTTSGVYDIIAYEYNALSWAVVNTCSDQVVVTNQPPMCEIVLQPWFEISNYQTVPYVGNSGAYILSDIEFTSITTWANPIVDYQWNIYSSWDFFSWMINSPYIFDNTLIVAWQWTPTVNINFSQYINDGNWPFLWVSLTVTDSQWYQAEYSTPLFRDHDDWGIYWIVWDTIVWSSSNGFNLDMSAEMLSSATSWFIPTNQFYWPDTWLVPTAIGIDRENDAINDEFFDYTGAHTNSHLYTTWVYTLNLNTSLGNTGQSYPMSYRTYPVACAVSCGNGIQEWPEQCDDGNDIDWDGCSSQCQIEVLWYCGDGIVDLPNGSGFMEQCDDGNLDDFDGCTSLCTTNTCQTTLLDKLDPIITYEWSYPIYTWSTGIVMILNTPTTWLNYTYQWDLSWADLTNINTLQFSWSSTGQEVQIFASANQVPEDFSFYVWLEVSNGQLTWYINGFLGCSLNGNCSYAMYNYYFNTWSVQWFTVGWSYNASSYIQSINATTTPTPIWFTWISISNPGWSYYLWVYQTGTRFSYLSPGSGYPTQLYSWSNTDTIVFSPLSGLVNEIWVSYYNTCAQLCGNGVQEWTEQCDDGNMDDFDGCTSQCIANSCIATVETIIPTFSMTSATTSWWELIWTGWSASGTKYYDVTFESTTVWLWLTYQWSRQEFINTTTGTALLSWSSTGQSIVLDFSGIDFTVTGGNMPYIRWELLLEVTQWSNTAQVQWVVILTKDGPMLIAANQNPLSFSWLTLTSQDDSMLWIADEFGGVVQTWIQNFVPLYSDAYKDRYPLRPNMTSWINITGINNMVYHTYTTGNDDVTPYFWFAIDQLFGPITGVVVTGVTYQQSYVSYNNSCFIQCGNGVLEAGEQCDDDNTQDGDGCSSQCSIEQWDCSRLTGMVSSWYAPHNVSLNITPNVYTSWYVFNFINRWDGNYGNIFTGNTHIYPNVGYYNASIRINPILWTGTQVQCFFPINVFDGCGNGVIEWTEQCDEWQNNGDLIHGCSVQCTYEEPFCSTPLLPSFEISSFQTGSNTSGEYLSELILTDTTIATNVISWHEWHVYTSDSYFTSWTQWVLDDTWIVWATWTNTVTIDLSWFDATSTTMWVSLSVTDSSWYQGEAYYMLSYLDDTYQWFRYDGLTQTSFAASGILTITWSLTENSIASGLIATQLWPLSAIVSGQADTVTFIDRESDMVMDASFMNDTLAYGTSHQYTTGLHLMRVYTAFGDTWDAQATSYTSYPVICGQNTQLNCRTNNMRAIAPDVTALSLACASTCGDSLEQWKEQCDDGNLIDGDGCSASCTLEQASCDRFTWSTVTSGSVPLTVTWNIDPNIYTGWYQMPGIVRWDGSATGDIFTGNTHTYTWVWSYTGYLTTNSPIVCSPLSWPSLKALANRSFATEALATIAYDKACWSKRSRNGWTNTGSTRTGVLTEVSYTARVWSTTRIWKWIETENVSVMCPFQVQVLCTDNSQCSDWLVCTQDGTCGLCTDDSQCALGQICLQDGSCGWCANGATNAPACDVCPAGQSLRNGQCRTNWWGGWWSTTDYCPDGDFSDSYYDRECGSAPQHLAAPVGKACKYDDEQYLTNWPFTDTLKHRASPYIDVMQYSCMHRWRFTNKGEWKYDPDANITRAEVLKTFVKIEWVVFDDFTIQTENKRYTKAIPFADVSPDHWFAHYAQYAKDKWLTDGLTTNKNWLLLQPDILMTRYEAVKIMVIAYESIHKVSIKADDKKVLGDMIDKNNPYHSYVMKALSLWFISWVPQKDGTYDFKWQQYITRAEFAKIVANAFSDQLFDVQEIIVTHPIYGTILKAVQKVEWDKVQFLKELIIKMSRIDEAVFMKTFKIRKMVFLDALYDTLLQPMLQEDN